LPSLPLCPRFQVHFAGATRGTPRPSLGNLQEKRIRPSLSRTQSRILLCFPRWKKSLSTSRMRRRLCGSIPFALAGAHAVGSLSPSCCRLARAARRKGFNSPSSIQETIPRDPRRVGGGERVHLRGPLIQTQMDADGCRWYFSRIERRRKGHRFLSFWISLYFIFTNERIS